MPHRPSTEASLKLERLGDDLGIRLPAALAAAADLHAGQHVRILVENGRLTLIPARPTRPTLTERLALFDGAKHGGETMISGQIGAERR